MPAAPYQWLTHYGMAAACRNVNNIQSQWHVVMWRNGEALWRSNRNIIFIAAAAWQMTVNAVIITSAETAYARRDIIS